MDPRPFDCHNSGRTVSSSRNQPSSEPRSTAATEAWTQVPMFPQQALGPQLRGQPPPESYNMSTILAIVPIPPVPRTLQGFSNASGHGKAIAEFGSIGVGKQIPSHNGVTRYRKFAIPLNNIVPAICPYKLRDRPPSSARVVVAAFSVKDADVTSVGLEYTPSTTWTCHLILGVLCDAA